MSVQWNMQSAIQGSEGFVAQSSDPLPMPLHGPGWKASFTAVIVRAEREGMTTSLQEEPFPQLYILLTSFILAGKKQLIIQQKKSYENFLLSLESVLHSEWLMRSFYNVIKET